jgi:hypothetical protein
MDAKDLMSNAVHLTDNEFEQKLNRLIRENFRYQNLDQKNREVVMDLFKKYKKKIRDGVGISTDTLENEMHHLFQERLKLNLTEEDLKDIKEILWMFKR